MTAPFDPAALRCFSLIPRLVLTAALGAPLSNDDAALARRYAETAAALVNTLRIDGAQRKEIMGMEQGTEEWKRSREGRATMSNIAAMVGHSPYGDATESLARMLGDETFKGNRATEWGNAHEDVACDVYSSVRAVEGSPVTVTHSGLVVSVNEPWFGASPDGWVHEADGTVNLLEIKCPASRKPYAAIPLYYYDQMQGQMAVCGGRPACDFFVWTPSGSTVQRVPFDRDYWEALYAAAKEFYFFRYLPERLRRALEPSTPLTYARSRRPSSKPRTETRYAKGGVAVAVYPDLPHCAQLFQGDGT